jgi:hypothetical protein
MKALTNLRFPEIRWCRQQRTLESRTLGKLLTSAAFPLKFNNDFRKIVLWLHWLLSKSFNPIGIELENTQQLSEKLAKLVRIFVEAIVKQIFEYPRKKTTTSKSFC